MTGQWEGPHVQAKLGTSSSATAIDETVEIRLERATSSKLATVLAKHRQLHGLPPELHELTQALDYLLVRDPASVYQARMAKSQAKQSKQDVWKGMEPDIPANEETRRHEQEVKEQWEQR